MRQAAQELGQWDTKSETAAFDPVEMVRLLHEGRKRARETGRKGSRSLRRRRRSREARRPLDAGVIALVAQLEAVEYAFLIVAGTIAVGLVLVAHRTQACNLAAILTRSPGRLTCPFTAKSEHDDRRRHDCD
jgi:hypothetical protein